MTDHLPNKPKRKRRIHSPEFKAKVVALSQEPNASRAEVARRFDLNDNLVHKWCVAAKQKGLPAPRPDFIELPTPQKTSLTANQVVLFEYATQNGQLKIHWPLTEINQSIPWIKALGL